MKKDKLVSIIIPTYNRGKLIKKSINSVLKQTYKNIEVIIVDDASSDNTEEIVKSIKDKRVKYYTYKNNKGACYARNYGIKKSTGEYIAFQDSDDIFRETKIEEQLQNLIKNKADLDFCKIIIHPNEVIVPSEEIEGLISKNNINKLLCENGNFISTQAILARKEIFNDECFDKKLPRLQDYDLVLRLSNKYKFSFTNKVLVDLYQQKDSISKSNDKLLKAINLMIQKEYNFNKVNLISLLLKTCCNSYFESEVSNYNRIINSKEETINQLNKDNLKLINENKELYNRINELNKINNNLQNEISGIYKSKSWKITKPLRKVSKIVKGNKK